jgi:hypothetical protein
LCISLQVFAAISMGVSIFRNVVLRDLELILVCWYKDRSSDLWLVSMLASMLVSTCWEKKLKLEILVSTCLERSQHIDSFCIFFKYRFLVRIFVWTNFNKCVDTCNFGKYWQLVSRSIEKVSILVENFRKHCSHQSTDVKDSRISKSLHKWWLVSKVLKVMTVSTKY